MPFTGPLCILMKTLIEKKYALPNRVIDGIIDYFVKFALETKALPVIWHQMVLRFCEYYCGNIFCNVILYSYPLLKKGHFSELQKKALK